MILTEKISHAVFRFTKRALTLWFSAFSTFLSKRILLTK